MKKSDYGDPVYTVRLAKWQISGLRSVAFNAQTTASAILRDLISEFLCEHGITESAVSVIDGQCKMDV